MSDAVDPAGVTRIAMADLFPKPAPKQAQVVVSSPEIARLLADLRAGAAAVPVGSRLEYGPLAGSYHYPALLFVIDVVGAWVLANEPGRRWLEFFKEERVAGCAPVVAAPQEYAGTRVVGALRGRDGVLLKLDDIGSGGQPVWVRASEVEIIEMADEEWRRICHARGQP